MLQIDIPSVELWDENINQFVSIKGQTLKLEHSLVSLSKWESKWHKPFLNKDEKTTEEVIDYIRCMNMTPNVDDDIFKYLTNENMITINNYINDPMTATTINEQKSKVNNDVITSELIYYWMISLNIPVEFQKWHINRLLTLIRVCNIKNEPPKKMSRNELLSRNAALNAQRRKMLNSKG